MDKLRLEYEIKKAGYSIETFADALGMSKSAFYRKLKGVSEFSLGEIKAIMGLLELETPMGIFFTEKVS